MSPSFKSAELRVKLSNNLEKAHVAVFIPSPPVWKLLASRSIVQMLEHSSSSTALYLEFLNVLNSSDPHELLWYMSLLVAVLLVLVSEARIEHTKFE